MKKFFFLALAGVIALGAITSCHKHKDPVMYTVTFNTLGGSSIPSERVEAGKHATRPAATPTREGYTFANWYHDENKGRIWDFTNDMVNSNVTIYAGWNENQQGGEELATLIALIEEVEALDGDDYTSASWAALEDALDNAREIAELTGATADDYLGAIDELQGAYDDLVERGDKTDLGIELETAAQIDSSLYTPESWAPMQDAINNGLEVYNDPDATVQDVAYAIAALEDALEGLVRIS